ncbi:hypothetical protein ASPFODRAFT_588204 [Aspergillus luchuensis CBS 106.47]|uniref:Uncharacterized protein n=1 Tax=Aspergillus luchuensis (strain CBS 106.47) TaxID=1137211 RepID=A0A1M3TM77_ASPLC|nr:hypothetical protein ASPFODRAFT_588204 [Aspergillus luchuensis CBS 106.47]
MREEFNFSARRDITSYNASDGNIIESSSRVTGQLSYPIVLHFRLTMQLLSISNPDRTNRKAKHHHRFSSLSHDAKTADPCKIPQLPERGLSSLAPLGPPNGSRLNEPAFALAISHKPRQPGHVWSLLPGTLLCTEIPRSVAGDIGCSIDYSRATLFAHQQSSNLLPVPVRISISLSVCLAATRSVFLGQVTISLPRPIRPNHSVARYILDDAEQDASKRDVFWEWRQKQST